MESRRLIIRGHGLTKIKGGYYIKARSIANGDISKCAPAVREIWDYLLREANHSDAHYGGRVIKRGQLFREYITIREALSWNVGYRRKMYSEDVTKKAMKALRSLSMITTARAPGGVLITVCDYDTLQDPSSYEGTSESTSEGTTKAPMRHQCGTTTNKKKKNDKKKITPGDDHLRSLFGEWWNSDNFKSAWGSWVAYRIEIKKKLTPSMIEGQAKKLMAYDMQTAIAMIEQTITNGWTGLFPLKNQPRQSPGPGATSGFDATEDLFKRTK